MDGTLDGTALDGFDEGPALGNSVGAVDGVILGSMDGTLDGTALDGFDEGPALGNPEGTTVGSLERVMIVIGFAFEAEETYPQMGWVKDMLRFTVTSYIRAQLFMYPLYF